MYEYSSFDVCTANEGLNFAYRESCALALSDQLQVTNRLVTCGFSY